MNASRSIPSLDGLRAVAILLVLASHLQKTLPAGLPMFFIERCGSLGVNMFFVISGFLITHLLVRELDAAGTVDLKRFYARRSFRIFPPFYAYLFVVALLRVLHPDLFSWASLLSAGTYLWNYNLHANGWLLGHTWSLSLEEQFYLLWPMVIRFVSRRSSLKIAMVVIVVSPVLRVGAYLLFPRLRDHIDMMLPTHLDTIMVGCGLALASKQERYAGFLSALIAPAWVATSIVALVVVVPLLEQRYRGSFYLPLGISITSFACGILLLSSVRNASSLPGRILNTPLLRHIGVISYSLYLWQQLFSGERAHGFFQSLLLIVLCAECSYWLVERPSFRLRDYVLRHQRTPTAAASRSSLMAEGAR